MFFCCCLWKKTMSSYFKCAARVVKQNNPCWLWISEAVKVLPRVTRQVSTQRKLLSGETWVMDWFSCNTGHNWRDIKWPGLDAVSSGGLLELQQANAEWINWFDLYLWPTAQIIKSKLHGCTAFFFSPPPPNLIFWPEQEKKKPAFYHPRKTEPPSSFLPLVPESRSIWQSAIAPRSCSCCNIGARQSPRRSLPSRELEAQKATFVSISFRQILPMDLTFDSLHSLCIQVHCGANTYRK